MRRLLLLLAVLLVGCGTVGPFGGCGASDTSTPPGRYEQVGAWNGGSGEEISVVCDHSNGNLIYESSRGGVVVVTGGCNR